MIVAIRVDASHEIGSGHLMRCRSLAKELRRCGADVTFICREHEGNLIELLKRDAYAVTVLPIPQYDSVNLSSPDDYNQWLGVPQTQDALETKNALTEKPVDWLIVDHYAIDATWERLLRPHVQYIFVIDDLSNRKHCCDLLLDQNLTLQGGKGYNNLVPANTRLLLGTRFALLHPEFANSRQRVTARDGHVKRVQICFGGGTADDYTVAALNALLAIDHNFTQIDVVVGQAHLQGSSLRRRCEEPINTTLHCQTDQMATLLADTDLAIGAGGTMNWERACLGVPTIAFGISDNQRPILEALSTSGCVLGVPQNMRPSEPIISAWVTAALSNPWLLNGISRRCLDLVDGLGIQRVTKQLLLEMAS